jgi:hypothetical protein
MDKLVSIVLLICYFPNVTNCETVIHSIPAMGAKVRVLTLSAHQTKILIPNSVDFQI